MTVLDLESAALPEDQLALVKPEFLPARNLKDPEKIKADVLEKEQAWRDRAALSPLTGQILVIGLMESSDGFQAILEGDELLTLPLFWWHWAKGGKFVGFNIKDFDMRFIVTRSRLRSIPVPRDLFEGRWWATRIVDLMEVFCCYSRDTAGYSLNAICKAMGLGEKNGNGKDFARLYAEDREKALEYLRQDLALSAALAKRLGIT